MKRISESFNRLFYDFCFKSELRNAADAEATHRGIIVLSQ